MMIATKSKLMIAFLAMTILTSPTLLQRPAFSAEPDGKMLRFGIGIALLASEKCEGIVVGPKFKQLLAMVRIGAKSSGKTLDEQALYERSKQEAATTLKRANKELCATAIKLASDDGVISLR